LPGGYEPGSLESNAGLVRDCGAGATTFQNSDTRMRSTPSVRSVSSVWATTAGLAYTSSLSSWKVDSWLTDARAAGTRIRASVPHSAAAPRNLIRWGRRDRG